MSLHCRLVWHAGATIELFRSTQLLAGQESRLHCDDGCASRGAGRERRLLYPRWI